MLPSTRFFGLALWLSPAMVTLATRPAVQPSPKHCRIGVPLGETLKFAGVAEDGRPTSRLHLWSDTGGKLSYSQTWRSDSATSLWEGSIRTDSIGVPSRFSATNRYNSQVWYTETVERSGDSIVSVRNGKQTTVTVASDIIPAPTLVSTPVMMVLTQCALQQPNHEVQTLRTGKLNVTAAATLKLSSPRAQAERLTLYAMRADSDPDFARIWLDGNNRLVATTSTDGPATIVVAPAYAGRIDQLLLAEAHAAELRMLETSRQLGAQPPNGTAFVHAKLLDVEHGRASENMSVFVAGNRIHTIQADSSFRVPRGANVIDAKGATLLPGLWDLGQHHTNGPSWATVDFQTRDLLSRGVTSIQEMDADTIFTPLIARRVASGTQIGPRIFPTCYVDGWYPDTVAGAVPQRRGRHGQVRNPVDVRALVRRCKALGMGLVMLSDNLPKDLTRLVIADAHHNGMRVTGDALRGRTTTDLIHAGYDQFAHVFQALSPFVDTRGDSAAWLLHRQGGIASFWVSGPVLSRLDLTSPAIRVVVALLAQNKVALQTTLCVYPPINHPGLSHDTIWDRASFEKLQEFTKILHHAAVPLFIGTDSACPLTREIELLSGIGFSNAELLRMVTIDAATAMHQEQQLGSIAVGKLGDMILVDGDPLEHLSDLSRVVTVMKNGVLYTDIPRLRADLPFLPSR